MLSYRQNTIYQAENKWYDNTSKNEPFHLFDKFENTQKINLWKLSYIELSADPTCHNEFLH